MSELAYTLLDPERCTPRDLLENSFVYFISAPKEGLIKIGYTRVCPDNRLINVRSATKYEVERFGVLRAGRNFEQVLHHRFAIARDHQEWFTASPELLDFIRERALPWTKKMVFPGAIPKQNSQTYLLENDPWFADTASTLIIESLEDYRTMYPLESKALLIRLFAYKELHKRIREAVRAARRKGIGWTPSRLISVPFVPEIRFRV